MARPLQVTPALLEQVANMPAVKAKLRDKAERVLPRAQRIAAAADALELGRRLHVEEGVRPGTKADGGLRRPYARIAAKIDDDLKDKDARAKLTRRQILRRASRA